MSILTGTDLSEASLSAITTAARLARRRDTALEIIHCVQWADPDALWRHLVETPWEQPDKTRARAQKRLEAFIDEHLPDDLRPDDMELSVELAHTDDTLVERSNAPEVEIVVVGASGHGRVASMFVGSTAEYCVRSCHVPVLTVPHDRDLEEIDHVLAPVDLSEPSRASLRTAARWARRADASLEVLRAVPMPAAGLVPADIEIPTGDPEEHRDRAEEQLREFVDATDLPELRDLETTVSLDPPFAAILERAEGADLCVMGTHGRRGLERFLLGSTTAKVLRRIKSPLLTIRPGLSKP